VGQSLSAIITQVSDHSSFVLTTISAFSSTPVETSNTRQEALVEGTGLDQ